ncbi:MAG: hypothetical protein ACRYFZ_19775 [Janthinobacterium lividum]
MRVNNPHTGLIREYCTTGNFLKGALHREYKLDFDDESIAKVYHIAASNRKRYFEFKDDSARYNISASDYTMAELTQLEKKINFDSLAVQIRKNKNWSTNSLPDKTIRLYAHALFNRGILTGENSCYGGQLKSVR